MATHAETCLSRRTALGALGALPLAALAALRAAEGRKPNILLIYTDDHGWADLGAQGVDADIRTPNFDQLARDGVRFARGYVTAPQCVPSRCGVLTGRYQQRFGVEDNNQGPLPLTERTIAQLLKPAGYLSGFVGKSHLDVGRAGDARKAARVQPDHFPNHLGFDEYWRGELRQYYASHDLSGQPFADAPHLVSDNRFRVVVQTAAALSFLDRRAARPDQPWFLYLAWYAPHVPLESPEPWFSRTPATLPLKRRQALAMIAAMDDGLGLLRAKLKAMGQERETLVFVIGDNGAPLGDAWDGSLNWPMRGQKGMLSEGGIRTPFVAAWPGRVPAGQVYDRPVSSLDVAATAVDLAGLPPDPRLDGVNLLPYLTGARTGAPHETLYWRWGAQAAVLEHPYKLIKLGALPPLLFDVTTPEGENLERDLAAQHPELVQRLLPKLEAWAQGLKPAGLLTDDSAFSRHHQELFREHHLLPAGAPTAPEPAADGTVQGWLARNGTLTVQNGALVLTPAADLAANVRPFLTNARLDCAGPVTVTLRVRARTAGDGPATVTWRTKEESFVPRQSTNFVWPVGQAWGEVKVRLAEPGRILHVRLTPPKGATGVEIQSIEFQDSREQKRGFRFDGK